MNIDELEAGLLARKAIIVHFSHLSNMRKDGVFPDDLQNAISKKNCWPLSCCVLWPGHRMERPGEVGVIFRPTCITQILSVSKTDSGSSQLACGEEISGGVPLTNQGFQETFKVADKDYNEWRVKGAEVFGIFLIRENVIQAKARQKIGNEDSGFYDDISPKCWSSGEVRRHFPKQKLFTMDTTCLREI